MLFRIGGMGFVGSGMYSRSAHIFSRSLRKVFENNTAAGTTRRTNLKIVLFSFITELIEFIHPRLFLPKGEIQNNVTTFSSLYQYFVILTSFTPNLMNNYGLIGKTLRHSYSKDFFDKKFSNEGLVDYSYQLYELASIANLREWALSKNLQGFNVTVPYKEAIMSQLEGLSTEAQAIGAVNVVKVQEGQLWGYNTDAAAFESTLRPLLQPWHSSALILGTGGAAKGVAYALRKLNIDYRFVSRTKHDARTLTYPEAVNAARENFLIVNATPVGMFPNNADTPWKDTQTLSPRHLCYDLVYNPEKTLFLQQAEITGASIQNGLSMLYSQAELSWRIWESDIKRKE